MEKKSKVLQSVQILRAIAAMAVAAYHTQATFVEHSSVNRHLETYLFEFGAVGVHIFFVISGLVMMITTNGKAFSFLSFMKRRFIRIYPIYWICVIIYLMIYAALGVHYNMSPTGWLGTLLLFPGYSANIIGPGWTLAYEVFFYFTFAIAMSFTKIGGKFTQEISVIFLGIIFIIAIAFGRAFPGNGGLYSVATNVLLLEFISGTAIGWLISKDRLPEKFSLFILIGAILGYALALIINYDVTTRVLTMGVASLFLVLGAVSAERRYGMSNRLLWLSKLGDSSYALYLIHVVIVALLIRVTIHLNWNNLIAPWVVALLTLPVLVFVGHQLHFKIEQPILARLNRRDVAARSSTKKGWRVWMRSK